MKSSPGLSSPSPGALRLSTITDTPETHTSLRSSAVLCRARRPAAEHHHRYGHRRSDRAVRRVPPGIRRYAPLHHRHGGPRGVTQGEVTPSHRVRSHRMRGEVSPSHKVDHEASHMEGVVTVDAAFRALTNLYISCTMYRQHSHSNSCASTHVHAVRRVCGQVPPASGQLHRRPHPTAPPRANLQVDGLIVGLWFSVGQQPAPLRGILMPRPPLAGPLPKASSCSRQKTPCMLLLPPKTAGS